MELNLSTILALVTAFLAGGVAALKIIAPRTKTTKDDQILAYAEAALEVLPKPAPVAAKRETAEVKTVAGFDPKANVRDHR